MNADDIRTAIKLWLITLDGEGRSPHTTKSYQAHMHMFVKWLGERELDVFTWRLFMSEIRKTYSPYTCRTLCATARSFVGFCIREGILEDDSLLRVMKLPRVPDTPRNTLSAGQVKAMAAYLSSDRRSYGVRNYAAVALLLDTGLRAGELLGLQLDDMVDDDYLRVRRSKNGKPRLVPMGAKSQKALMRYLTLARPQLEPRCNSLFVGDGKGHHRDRGQPWTRHGIQCFFQRLSKKLGFKVTAHLMRHTFTTQALRAGADIETIRRIAGWTDYRMIMTYAHLQADDLREKHRKFSPFDRLG